VLVFLNREIKPKYLILGIVAAIVLHYSNSVREIVYLMVSINLIPHFIADYIGSSYHAYTASLVFHLKTLQQILTIIVMIICFERYKHIVGARVKYYNLLFNAYYIGTILIIVFSSLAIFAFRFSAHFMSVEPIILTYAIWLFRDKKIPYVTLLIIALLVAFYNYVVLQRIENYVFLLQ